MKFSVSSYSFSQLIKKGEMTQLDTIAKAKEMGFDGIEFVEIKNHTDGDLAEYAKRLKGEAERCDIEVSNVSFGADFINNDFDSEVKRVKEMIGAAAETGTKFIRHDVLYSLPQGKSFGLVVDKIADACREIADYTAKTGITAMVENHGFICQDSVRMEELFTKVNHPNFRLLCDMGNFLCADENPLSAVSRVAPLTGYVHAKDFIVKSGNGPDPGKGFFKSRGGNYLRGTIAGHGTVPVKQIIETLRKAGFDGWIALEFEGLEDALFGIETGFENLKKYYE
ncbi:MAG: sugar phosphate isomerase/epimerase family protein [Monoglobales bacterium]